LKFTKYLKRKKLKNTFESKLQYSFTMGTDGITTTKFSEIIDEEISIIKRKIKNHTYNISPYKEQLILKSRSSNPRMISIPTHRDKLVLSALQKFLAEKYEDKITYDNVDEKIHVIKNAIASKEYDSFIKVDIKNFYPNIDHALLLDKVREKVNDDEALYLLEKALIQITISQGRRASKSNNLETKGVAQGLSISNILASIYMHDLDEKYHNKKNLVYFRYVDDILILCNKSDVEAIKTSISNDAKELILEVHEFKEGSDKSVSGTIHKDKFQFLGFEFYENILSVREQSVDKLRDRIIGVFYNNIGAKDKDLYRELNLKISGCVYDGKDYGWMQFFRQIDDLTLLYSLDSFVKSLFRRFNRKYKEKKLKKFTKTYFLLKNYEIDKLNKNTYIPKYELDLSTTDKQFFKILKNLFDDVEFY